MPKNIGKLSLSDFSRLARVRTSNIRLLQRCQPDKVYNLAAQSFVSVSFEQPTTTAQITGLGALNLLEGIRVSTRRSASNYTGVGQDRNFVVPKIVAHYATRAREIELGSLDVAREFSDVRMVASVYRRLIDAAPAGETFNVCSGVAYSLSEVLELMSDIAGYDVAVKVNPAFVRTNEVKRLVGSNAKLRRMIGNLSLIPLSETLRWMYYGKCWANTEPQLLNKR